MVLEHDNLRAALRWSIDHGQGGVGLRLGAALGSFWFAQGHYAEGAAWLTELLALPTNQAPTSARVAALAGALGNQNGSAEALRLLGQVAALEGDDREAPAQLAGASGSWPKQFKR